MDFQEGKYAWMVKIGEKGQFVIPKEARALFSLQEGDSLLLMADKNQGIAIQPFSYAEAFWNAVSGMKREK